VQPVQAEDLDAIIIHKLKKFSNTTVSTFWVAISDVKRGQNAEAKAEVEVRTTRSRQRSRPATCSLFVW